MAIPEREITLAENGSICLHSHKEPELQITGGIEDNSKIFFLFLNKNICCDPTLEPSQRDFSNDGSENMFLLRTVPKLSLLLLLIWSTEGLLFNLYFY